MASVCVLAALAAVAVIVPGRTEGASRPAPSTRLSLLSPGNDSTQRVEARTLVVRLKATDPDFRATLDGRDVTARFGHAAGGVRTARFVRGRDFSLGRGSFMAAVGRRGSKSVRTVGFAFTAWRLDRRPLVFHRRARERARGGELSALTIDVVSDAHVTGKRIWINGRRIRDHLLGPGDLAHPIAHGCGCHLDIGANHGLRFGRNRVTVEYSHAGWRFQRTTRTFTIARTAPLAGAGHDRFGARGQAVALNASSSRAARPGDRLIYRWRIVSRPRRGRAHLIGARRMHAHLIADKPGAYRVRVRVTERPERRSATAIGSTAALARLATTPTAPTTLTTANTPAPRGCTPLDPRCKSTLATALTPVAATTSDDVDVAVAPTSDPMGVPIQTIAGGGAIQVGPTTYPMRHSDWMQILVLDQASLSVVSDTFYTPQQLSQAKQMLDALPAADHDLVIVSVPNAQNLVYPTSWAPQLKANFDYKTLQSIVGAIGGVPVTPDGWSILANKRFSIIGQKGTPAGQAWQSSGAAAGRPAQPGPDGSLNGYMQMVNGNAYSFVSPTNLPIDTEAPGSNGITHNVITIANQTFRSATIAGGDSAAQLVVLDDTGTRALAQATFTLIKAGGASVDGYAGDPAHGRMGTGVKGLAYAMQYFDRSIDTPALVIVQVFGQAQFYGESPNGSPNWVNDNVDAANLRNWAGGVFGHPDGTSSPVNALYNVWNPGYPTVAGQVGSLTSGAGHEFVSQFGGGGQNNYGYPNGGLTLVASTHPYDGRENFVQGQTYRTSSQPLMVGTLTRTKQGQWTAQTASASPTFHPSELWQTAFAAPKPWPYTSPGKAPDGSDVTPAQARQYQAADRYIASQLWPGQASTDVRPQYVLRKSDAWETNARITQTMPYPDNGPALGFSRQQFSTLQQQLATEMGYVAQIKNLVEQNWERIFTDNKFNGYVDLQSIARNVVDDAQANHEKFQKETTDLNWLDISDYSLEVGASILGFTPAAEFAEPMGLLANVLGLASASMGGEGNKGGTKFDSQAIWDKSSELGNDLVQRMNKTNDALGHIEDLFLGNWAKLRRAGQNAGGAWAYGTTVQRVMKQSLAVTTTRAFYEALLPLTYTEWIIDPNATGATDDPKWGPSARTLPGRTYRCWSAGDRAYPSPPGGHPFAKSPDGGLFVMGVHGWSPPANTAPPAAANQSWWALQVLKSVQDPMKIVIDYWRGNNPTIWHRGSDPPASLVNPLFEPIDPSDNSGMPTQLGLDKRQFFGDYNNGWGWRKAVCS